jgi:hypothetical protein
MREHAGEYFSSDGGKAALWFGVLAGPLGWFLHLAVSYSLVIYACTSGNTWPHHVVTLLALGLPGAGLWLAWGSWRRVRRLAGCDADVALRRSEFLSLTGVALSGYFLLVVLVAEAPNLVYGPCVNG